jgi:hypothetical protein
MIYSWLLQKYSPLKFNEKILFLLKTVNQIRNPEISKAQFEEIVSKQVSLERMIYDRAWECSTEQTANIYCEKE